MLAEPQKVDVLSVSPEGHQRLSLVIEAGEWERPDVLHLLQDKINNYAAFVLDGEMHRKYPDSVGKPATIAVCPVEPVPADAAAFLMRAAEALQAEGLALVVDPLPPEEQAAPPEEQAA